MTLLREFQIYVDPYDKVDADLVDWVFGNARVVGHAYRQALGRYETNGTWKVMVEYWPDPPHRNRVAVDDSHDSVGVATVNLFEDFAATDLVNTDETQARLAVLEVLHAASLEVATTAGWDVGPFEAAYAIVRENPRYVVPGPWKANRKRTHQARVVFEEFWNGTRFHLEVRSAEAVTAYEPQWARLMYLGSRTVGAASEVKDPIWRAGGVVALRDRRGADILTVTIPEE